MALDHTPAHSSQWAAIRSIAENVGCHAETLRSLIREHQRKIGQRPVPTTDDIAAAGGWTTTRTLQLICFWPVDATMQRVVESRTLLQRSAAT